MRRWQWLRQWRLQKRGARRGIVAPMAVALAMVWMLGGIAMAAGDPPPCEPGQPEASPGRADESTPPLIPAPPIAPAIRRDKLDGALAAVADAAMTAGDEAAISAAQARHLAVSGGLVRVLVETDNPDLTPAKAAIVAAGGAVEGEYADTIQALMPPSGLDALAASPEVRYVRAPARGLPGRSP